jgi:hypothetical protein
MSKICRTCKETKAISEYSFASSGKPGNNFRYRKRTLKSQCKKCDALYAREWRKKHTNYKGSGKITKYGTDRLLASAVSNRLTDAKGRIKKYKQPPTDLTKSFLVELFKKQGGCCAISGEKLSIKQHQLNALSLDKINSNRAYTQDNVQWLSWKVNRAKGEMDMKEFLNMCRMITERCNDYSERKYS